jgi:hypothetical protein
MRITAQIVFPNAAWESTIQFGAGCSAMAPKGSNACGAISSRPTSRGAPTKPTFECSGAGVTCNGRSIPAVPPSISGCRLRDADAGKRLFRKALCDRCHHQPRVMNTDLAPIYSSAIPDIRKEGRNARAALPTSACTVLEQHPGTGPSSNPASSKRQARVSGIPSCATNDSGLRGDE